MEDDLKHTQKWKTTSKTNKKMEDDLKKNHQKMEDDLKKITKNQPNWL